MNSGPAPSPAEALLRHEAAMEAGFQSGQIKRMLIQYLSIAPLLVILYLALPHKTRPWLYALRWPLVIAITMWQIKCLSEYSSSSPAISYALGITGSYVIFRAFELLIFTRPQWDAKRVGRSRLQSLKVMAPEHVQKLSGFVSSKGITSFASGASVGTSSLLNNGTTTMTILARPNTKEFGFTQSDGKLPAGEWQYFWQSYPSKFGERLIWAIDLFSNMRGDGWNTMIRTLPAWPADVRASLGEEMAQPKPRRSPAGNKRYASRKEILHDAAMTMTLLYFALDLLKTVAMKDPYMYLGPNDYDLPSHLQGLSSIQINMFRRLMWLVTILLALTYVFTLGPLVFGGLLGPSRLGIRGEAWMFTETFGSPSVIFNHGLRGLWSSWWHQIFRSVFTAPINYMLAKGWLKRGTLRKQVAELIIAFGVSGLLHAAGSMTMPEKTRPWYSFAFFVLQGIGMVIQLILCRILKPLIVGLPSPVRKLGNFAVTFTWLYMTSWMLTDDLSRSGVFLEEPVPISIMTALGYGNPGESCIRWTSIPASWHNDLHWWNSGIAI